MYQQGGTITADVSVLNAEQNQGPERLFQILEEAVVASSGDGQVQDGDQRQGTRDIVDLAWERVRKWFVYNESSDIRAAAAYIRGNSDNTPLHLMCKLKDPPKQLVNDLVASAPEIASFADSYGWLPLHHACANGASTEVLQILIMAYPDGKLIQDTQNRTPLHFYATRNADSPEIMTRNVVLLADTGAGELADRGGMLPMHYACAYGSSAEVLKVLYEAYPESLRTKDNKGKTPMHLTMVNAHRDSSPEVLQFLLDSAGNDTVNLRDDEGNLPLHLLNLGLRGQDLTNDEDKLANVSECLRIYFAGKPSASADFLAEIQNLPEYLQDVAVISPHVRDILNRKIVKRFPTAISLLDGYFYFILIVFFEIATEYHLKELYGERSPVTKEVADFSVYCIFAGGGYFLLRELVQLMSLIGLGLGLGSWFTDTDNWIDVILIASTLFFGLIMFDNQIVDISPQGFRAGCALTKGFLWVALIFFLKSARINFAVFLDGLVYVVKQLLAFVMAALSILIGFALMFYIYYNQRDICTTVTPEDCRPFPHCSLSFSLLKVYTMMMGEIGSESRYDGLLTAQLFYILYSLLVVILLSNVLIAIVTDSYEFIQNDRAAIVFWSNRLDFVAEMDGISSVVNQRFFCSNKKKKKGAPGAPSRVQERPGGATEILDDDDDDEKHQRMRNVWGDITGLFQESQYYEEDQRSWEESVVSFLCQMVSILIVIPVWILLGFVTAGVLWPPQVREYLFIQSEESAVSQASREKKKLLQLKEIQDDISRMKAEIQREIATDRNDLTRMKAEVDAVQLEVISDLRQIKELMTTLLDLGGME